MLLKEAILNYKNYEDTEDVLHTIYAKRISGRFQSISDAVVLELTTEEMEMNLKEIANLKCPDYEYFLEMYILQDFYNDLEQIDEYKSNEKKVERIIYYAEFDA
jgi:DNA topoisomerase IA